MTSANSIDSASPQNVDLSSVLSNLPPDLFSNLNTSLGGNSGNPKAIPTGLKAGEPFWHSGVGGAKALKGGTYIPSPKSKFTPIQPNRLESLAVNADLDAIANAHQAWNERYPLLHAADLYNLNSSYENLAGKQDPFVANALNQAGLSGYDFGNNPYLQARNQGSAILSKEQRDRTYAQDMFNQHPVTKLGLGPADIVNIAMWNTGGQNAFSRAAAEQQLQNVISNDQSQAQLTSAIIGGLSTAGAAGARGYFSNPNNTLGTNAQLGSSYYAPAILPYGGDMTAGLENYGVG